MSLDIYLKRSKHVSYDDCKTFIVDEDYVFNWNITHNLGDMADKAGVYQALWRPEELKIDTASDLIPYLEKALTKLNEDPNHYRSFEPSNGWGSYEGLVDCVDSYLSACKQYPNSKIEVSR